MDFGRENKVRYAKYSDNQLNMDVFLEATRLSRAIGCKGWCPVRRGRPRPIRAHGLKAERRPDLLRQGTSLLGQNAIIRPSVRASGRGVIQGGLLATHDLNTEPTASGLHTIPYTFAGGLYRTPAQDIGKAGVFWHLYYRPPRNTRRPNRNTPFAGLL